MYTLVNRSKNSMDYLAKENILERLYNQFRFLFLPSKSNNHCPKFLQGKFLLYCVICLIVLKIIIIAFSINFSLNIFFADITKITLNNLVNYNREALGIQPLIENEKLNQIAELRAKDMVEKEYFSHQSPEGKSPWDWFSEAGYNYKYAGENLAVGFSDSKEIYYAWIDSPSHKENILNPKYKEMGTAILGGFGENNAIVVVQLFGSPSTNRAIESMPNNNINKKPTENSPNLREKIEDEVPKDVLPKDVLKESDINTNTNTEEKDLLQGEKGGKGGLYYAFLNFIIYDYDIILKNVIYGLLAITTSTLFISMLYGFNAQYKNILFRSIIFIVLLSLTALLDKGLIIKIIPHQIII